MSPSLRSPKQPQARDRRDWYPYYAGFTENFVESLLSQYIPTGSRVLDPWNGSGTTTAVCAQQGFDAVGLDINPALTVVSRGRLTPSSVADSITSLGLEILDAGQRLDSFELSSEDLLLTWFQPAAVCRVRALQSALHKVLARHHDMPTAADTLSSTSHLPILACFYYTALFAATHDLLRQFKTSNPTWITSPTSPRRRLSPTWNPLRETFTSRVKYFLEKLRSPASSSTSISIATADANTVSSYGLFEACITSPPYATRIDYVKNVLPELALLGANRAAIARLRRNTTGTPMVRNIAIEGLIESDTATILLERISAHPSHGSRNYYYPWMRNYLIGLQETLHKLAQVVTPTGRLLVVAQDSYYKEIRIPLQRVIAETLHGLGRTLVTRHDFPVTHVMARMNPSARRNRPSRQTAESVLVF